MRVFRNISNQIYMYYKRRIHNNFEYLTNKHYVTLETPILVYNLTLKVPTLPTY